ncbi:AbrB/MazE/SpoVT family DNA-binding domain-containing protein [Caedibacter taeniospiralis]|jgi:AbrB family looped-hinge helix DNA binding protein|uniref:AbrB/MazE/SpoVT family DNA-binding domain-containing protein n=1 Tax=Caedibacter taeniospiralis TaxID=28907 RepID=UPI000C280362|nr:AbrB/MazE/SpoVT family DNA-binding domain-containing protein [Caedibacter taeniospiralis]
MSSLSLRQSGGANIVSIPKKILQILNLHTGDKLDISVEDNKIVLTPKMEELSLEQMLAASPKSSFKLLDEDKEWMHDNSKGKEL